MACYIKNPHLFFIHIPKTGGNSISWHLKKNFRGHDWHKTRHGAKHADQTKIFEDTKETEMVLDRYTFFTVVRNPYDRMVSAYHYYLKGGGELEIRKNGASRRLPKTFEGFVRGEWENSQKWGCATKLQSEYFTQAEIIRFEHLEKDYFDFLLPRLPSDTNCTRSLEHANPSKHKPWQELYTPELAEIVYTAQKPDFDAFGYSSEIGAG